MAAILEQDLGSGIYANINYLNSLFDMNGVVTSALIRTDNVDAVKTAYKDAPNLAGMSDIKEQQASAATYMQLFNVVFYFYSFVGILIAFIIIYATSIISMAERKRELATLRVLGLQVGEVNQIIGLEYWILCVFGIIIGIPYAKMLKIALSQAIKIDVFTFPATLGLREVLWATAGCAISVLISNYVSKRKIRSFDMVEVLKDRE